MPGRKYSSDKYRYGFNGKENDNEIKGDGNQQDYGMRVYDGRIGKFLSVDPLYKDYPWNSTYAFAENDIIRSIDLDGLEKVIYTFSYSNKAWAVTKLELPTAGPLGNGVLVKFGENFFYGNEMPTGTTGEEYTKSYEVKSLVGYKIKGEKGGYVTIGYGHLARSKEDQDKYKEGSVITDKEADLLFDKDYADRAVNIPGLTTEQNAAVTDAQFKFVDTKSKAEKRYNSSDDKSHFTLKGSATKFLGNKVRAASNHILYTYGKYVKLDYSKSAQKAWKKAYDKLTTENKKKK